MVKRAEGINGGRLRSALRLLAVLMLIHAAWHLLYLAVGKPFLPGPAAAYRALFALDAAAASVNVGLSLMRVFAGVLLALAIGLPIGLAMGRSELINKLLDPVVYLTYPIPKIALLPVAMLLLGLGESSKIVMIMLILVFQIVISARDGVRAIPETAYDVMTSLGAGPALKLWHVTVPGALSVVLSTVRISLGTALSVLFFTEIYGTEYGMGYSIMDAWQRMNYPQMYAGILLFSLVGFALFWAVDLLEKRFLKWRKS